MELKTRILGHFLVVSLALNAGLLYRDYCNGAHISQDVFGFGVANKSDFIETDKAQSSKPTLLDDVIDALTTTSKNASLLLTRNRASLQTHQVIDLDHGDPTMYERYWQQMGDRTTVVIPGWNFISYFSDRKNLCWFLEPDFANAVTRLHRLVGNAVTDNRHIVVGTGSTQLFQAVLYAVSSTNASEPIDVVSAAPFYSMYPLITDLLKSGLYKWAGDAHKYNKKDKPYIELVTSPNNPDGSSRQAVVNSSRGILIHDMAYYWPQHTPISSPPSDHDIMLFTVSKLTGHAGTRLGWALVKNEEIARKMTEYIVITSIGVSKESQIRAAKILQVVSDTHEHKELDIRENEEPFFDHGYDLMEKRWRQLREAVEKSELFSLPEFPLGTCAFSGRTFATQPAFAWLKCEGEIEDCEEFLGAHNVLTRSGKHFGESGKYVRISVLPRQHTFDQFINRLATINST